MAAGCFWRLCDCGRGVKRPREYHAGCEDKGRVCLASYINPRALSIE